LKVLRESQDSLDLQIKKSESKLIEIIAAASQYFSISFSDSDSLIATLLIPPKVEEKTAPDREKRFQRKIERIRGQQTQLVTENERKVALLVSEFQQQRAQMQNEISALEQVGREQQQRIEEIGYEKKLIEEEKSTLLIQIQQLQSRTSENATLREKCSVLRASANDLKEQLSSAVKRIASLGNARTQAKGQIKEFRTEIADLQSNLEQLQREKNEIAEHYYRLSSVFDSAKQDIARMVSTATTSEDIIETQKKQIERFARAVERCEGVIRQQSEEIEANQMVKNKLMGLISTQSAIEAKLIELIENQSKVEPPKVIEKPVEIIHSPLEGNIQLPISSIPGFPVNLAGVVDEIGANPHIRIEAKLRQIVRVVCEWYQNELAEHENHFKSAISEYQRKVEEFESSFPELGNGKSVQKLVETFKQQKREITELRGQLRAHESAYTGLLLALESSTAQEAQRQFADLKYGNETITQQLLRAKRKRKTYRKVFDQQQREFECERESMTKQLESLNYQLKEAQNHITELETQLTACAHESIDSARMLQLEQTEIQLRGNLTSFEIKLQEEFEKNNTLEAQLEQRIDEVQVLSKQITFLKIQNRQQMEKLKQLRSTVPNNTTRERDKGESDAIYSYFQQVIDDLHVRDTDFQHELGTLNETIAQLQNSNQSLRIENSDLLLELERYRLNSATLERELDRARKVNESEARAIAFKHEFEVKNRIDECKSEFERSQRELIGFFALQFSSIVDLNEKLTQSNFKTVVQKLRSEFERLLSQDRNLRLLLSLGPKQSIEDAIARDLLTFR
jgi:chromosome segregation ATPase